MDGQFWIHFLQIMLIDLVLSGDNALVIGMACRGLPKKDQKRAIIYGTAGAILLRVGLTGLTTWMLDIPLIKALGGGMLLWIAVKLLAGMEEETSDVAYSSSLGQAVKTIILADFIMSLDNVLAVGGAAHGDLLLVVFGLGLSIPLLMWGSAWIARLMERFPFLVYLGGGILAYTATEMCLEDPYVWKIANRLLLNHAWTPVIAALLVILLGRWKRAH
ncbi:TerC family protein [Brevibacillus sp. SYP-B805]|uniref:TerC family protein n=1 Tax=Brevibacillus sp. SYP-B805 TaxID=1578199 RepID=UPI0013EBD027|nr:TerC family protein [Brevibacillus sp. SYP-B805]NGQ95301.1 TerC family protein [Brevibacillus sp. SYP-B805]